MKLLLKSLCFLVLLSAEAQIKTSFIPDPKGDYSKLDFTGDWYPKDPLTGNSYHIRISQVNGVLKGQYCFKSNDLNYTDCNPNNMVLQFDGNRIKAAMFSSMGGLIEGVFTIIDPNTITWESYLRMGKSITPKVMDFQRETPLYEELKLASFKINDKTSAENIKIKNGLNLDKTKIQLKSIENLQSIKITKLDGYYPSGYAIIMEGKDGEISKKYLVTINRELREISRVPIHSIEKNLNDGYILKLNTEIDKDLNITQTKTLLKNSDVVFQTNDLYELRQNGRFNRESIIPTLTSNKDKLYQDLILNTVL